MLLPHFNMAKLVSEWVSPNLATLKWGSCTINEYFLMDLPITLPKLTEIYDLYQWLQLQFYVLLMMGVDGTQNM